jgi:hypothetical protein
MPSLIRCAIHQPNFFPRLSTIEKLYASDIWVVLDNVQFARRDYQNRCALAPYKMISDGHWLSLPVSRPHGRASLISEIEVIDPPQALGRGLETIRHFYSQSPQWSRWGCNLMALFDKLATSSSLTNLSTSSTLWMLSLLGWRGMVLRSSDISTSPGRSLRLAELCVAVGATEYLCGRGGSRYLDAGVFEQRGVAVTYVVPTALDKLGSLGKYPQRSALDLLLRVSVSEVADALGRGPV